MDISFRFDPEILIGADTLSMAGTVCAKHGKRIMIAADHTLNSQTVERLKGILEDSGIEAIVFHGIEQDSSVKVADNIVELSHAAHCNAIIGFGGRKTQVIARMAAIMSPVNLTAFDLLDGRKFQDKLLPLIAIPTEGLGPFSLTDYFVAVDPRNSFIKSIPSPGNLYTAVIIDSSLFQFHSSNTASAYIFDCFLSAIEAYCSTKANFFSDALLERALNFLARLIKNGPSGINDGKFQDLFAQASFLTSIGNSASSPCAGVALAYALNARFPVSKQVSSAALLPFIAEKLVSARPEKMAKVSSFLGNTGKSASVAEAANSAVTGIQQSMEAFNIQPSLKEFNIPLDRVTAAVETARQMEFVANSPWTVSEEDVFELIQKII